jgi:hypothetical protein
MANVDQVHEWLEGVLEQGIDRLELRNKHDDARVRLWQWKQPPAAEKLASQITREAERDGACQAGPVVTYVLFAFLAQGEGYLARMPIQVEGRAKKTPGGDELESATTTGLVAMMMKQLSELHRLLIMSQEGRAEADARTIDRLLEQNLKHEMQRAALLEAWEKLQSMQLDRERERLEMQLSEQRQKYLGEKLDMVFPIVVNRLLGGGKAQGTPYLGEEIVRQIVGNLRPEEFESFMRATSMRPELQALFSELYMAYVEKEQARKATDAADAQPSPPGASQRSDVS